MDNNERNEIINSIRANNAKRSVVEQNLNIWKNKLTKLKQERVMLDEKLYKLDNKQLF